MNQELTAEQIQAALNGVTIPPQPQIMVDLQMEQVSPKRSIEHIADLISQDMGLSATILKIVNSDFYKLETKLTSVKEAVHLLGIDSVINIVNAQSIRGELTDEDIVALGDFWDSATDVAMVSAAIAKELDFANPDDSYTLGLFHNCAVPILWRRHQNYGMVMEDAYAHPTKRIIDFENETFKTNHAVVGYYVAHSWKLPDRLCQAIADHHSADRLFLSDIASSDEQKSLIAVLKMAEHICGLHKIIGKNEDDLEWERLETPILDYLNISDYEWQNMKDSMQEMLSHPHVTS